MISSGNDDGVTHLHDRSHLSEISLRTTLDQGNSSGDTELVDVSAGVCENMLDEDMGRRNQREEDGKLVPY